jgi:long-subunit acyl-CoA synthetase (AMP-forming)
MKSLLQVLDTRLDASHVVLQDSKHSYRWDEIRIRVLTLASRLVSMQISRVALHGDNNVEWLLVDLACQHAGILCVPLPVFFSQQQLAHVLQSCAVQAVFTSTPSLFAQHADEPAVNMLPGLALRKLASGTAPQLPKGTDKITFTSGSTGTPKGVCLSTAQLLLQAEALKEAVGLEKPVHLCVLPLGTLLENVAGVYAPLLAGGTVVLRSLNELGFAGSALQDPQKMLQALSTVQPDSIILIPQLLQLLVHAAKSGWKAPAFKFIAVGGARVASALIGEARLLGLPVYEGYGLSECASVVSLNTPAGDLPGSCGKPLPHINVEVEPKDNEIFVSGNAMLGYVGDPQSWYPQRIATGDLGHIDAQGFLHIDGRSKNLLISSYGRNIAPEWVESELLATTLFRDVVVMGDAKPWCSALLGPVASTIPDALIEQALAQVNQRLPDYARIKRWIRLAQPLAADPALVTGNGRPRRAAIAQRFQEDIDRLYAEPQLQVVAG